jgi:ATP-binding cassette subfamily B protein
MHQLKGGIVSLLSLVQLRLGIPEESKPAERTRSFWEELRLILQRGRQVWNLVPARDKAGLGAAAGIMALAAACSTALPVCLGRLVDGVDRGLKTGLDGATLSQVAVFYLFLSACAYLLRELLNVVRRYLVESTCTRIERDTTVGLVSHLMKVDLSSFTHEKVGALHGRIQRSVVGFVRFLRLSFLDFFPAILIGVFALITSISKQPWLGVLMLGVIPLSIYLTVRQLVSQKGVRLELLRSREHMDGTVVEQLSGLDYARAANTHGREVDRVADAAEKMRVKELRHHFQMSLFGSAKALNEGFFHLLIIGFAIFLAIRGTISAGDILMFSMLFLNVMAPVTEVHRVIDETHECSLQVGDLLDMMDQPADASFAPAEVREPRVMVGRPLVATENLCVDYRTKDGQWKRALDGISLAIRHGETIGVAGRSGSGKTTWIRVLLRLAHRAGGNLWLGRVPIDNVSREAIAGLIGYVGQSPFTFAGTIADNIAYGCDGVTRKDIAWAARLACIHDEIMAMPGGYDALVSERGQNLSGGQKQRIAIARVFLKNPPVLILDEGTSALDTISERKIQQALAEVRDDRTTVLIAHRLSTLLDTDRILVFDGGRIVETGQYEELIERDGVFAELVRCAQNAPAECHAS